MNRQLLNTPGPILVLCQVLSQSFLEKLEPAQQSTKYHFVAGMVYAQFYNYVPFKTSVYFIYRVAVQVQ